MRLLIISLFLILCSFTKAQSFEEITIATYHNFPPYIISKEKRIGLTYDLEKKLNKTKQASNNRYTFKVRIYPRARINRLLDSGDRIIVPWVSTSWFKKHNLSNAYYSSKLISDENVLISKSSQPINSLANKKGLSYSSIRGSTFQGVSEDFLLSNSRVNVSSYKQVFRMVLSVRVDFASMPRSVVDYYISRYSSQFEIHIKSQKKFKYDRTILINKANKELIKLINSSNKSLKL